MKSFNKDKVSFCYCNNVAIVCHETTVIVFLATFVGCSFSQHVKPLGIYALHNWLMRSIFGDLSLQDGMEDGLLHAWAHIKSLQV